MNDIYFFDFETTGTDPGTALPVSLACLSSDDTVIYNGLINPGVPIPLEASNVHGILDKHVTEAPSPPYAVWDMLRQVQEKSQQTPTFAGYNINRYDLPILCRCFPPWYSYGVLDVFHLVYRYLPTLKSKKLGDVYASLTGMPLVGAHGALEDCKATKEVLKALMERTNKPATEFVSELLTPKVYNTMPLGKYSGLPIDEVPISWARWMKNNATDLSPDLEATINYILGKHHE